VHRRDRGHPTPSVVTAEVTRRHLVFKGGFVARARIRRRTPKADEGRRRQTVVFRPKRLLPLIIAGSLLTAACGGGGGGNAPSTPPQMSSGRGQLIKSPPSRLSSLSASELLSTLSSSTQGQVVLQFASRRHAPLIRIIWSTKPSGPG